MDQEIINALLERIELLEERVSGFQSIMMEQDDIIKRWEAVHLPTPEVAIARMQHREAKGLPANYSHEESYILVWGAEKFERVWGKSAELYLKRLDGLN